MSMISGSELFHYVKYLAELGHRMAGTENDHLARQYIIQQFEEAGLQVKVEPFDFAAYAVNRAVLRVSRPLAFETALSQIHFDPYKRCDVLRSRCVVLPENRATESELEEYARELQEKVDSVVVITDDPHRFPLHRVTRRFGIFGHALQAVGAACSASEQVKNDMGEILKDAELVIESQMETRSSANIVGILPNPNPAGEIILCAHHDSHWCPGADDNASGVSVLMEMARILGREQPLSRMVRFIALGAEEWGRVGSRVYVKEHAQELGQCLAVLNLDSVGGKGGPITADIAGGCEEAGASVKQLSDKWVYKALNCPGFSGGIGSALIDYDILLPCVSCVPAWLCNAVEESGEELGYPIRATRYIGSDHATFALAGVPATSIGKGDTPVHTPQDNIGAISRESLVMVQRLCERVIRRLLLL